LPGIMRIGIIAVLIGIIAVLCECEFVTRLDYEENLRVGEIHDNIYSEKFN